MEFRIGELCRKEVIDVMDGSRYGYVGDAEIDLEARSGLWSYLGG